MPSLHTLYNEEVIQAHREALQALRELLAVETNPLERRRLAVAILKTRPVKATEPQQPVDEPQRTTVPQPHTSEQRPAPFWTGGTPTPTPTPFNDGALAHPITTAPPDAHTDPTEP